MTQWTAAIVLLWAYGVIGTCDIFYYHFYRFRLYERPESFREHLLHAAQVFLQPFVVAGLYVGRTGGLTLWVAAAIGGAQVAALLADVLEEHASRARLGGLPRLEYFIHIVVVMLHGASLALILGERPASAWSLNAPMLLEPLKLDWARWAVISLGAGAVPLGIIHVVLAVRGHKTIQMVQRGETRARVQLG
jgi:hypothetical protein